jgi:transposase
MMGEQQFETKLYYQLSLDRLVPEDHLLRRIAAAVDFSFVRPLCRPFYSHTGQPSVDPVVIFKMLLIGYLYGITSERRLAREVSLHLAYRWFLGYDFDVPTPDHSVLSKARARLSSEVFEEFFRRSIELCRQAGLVEEGPVYVDSTLIRAGASMDSLIRREDMVRPPLSIAEYLQRLDQEGEPAEGPQDSDSSRGTSPAGKPVPPNRRLVSRTDPEASLVNRPDFGRHLAYKAHLAVAGRRGQVITAAVATRSRSRRAPAWRSALATSTSEQAWHSRGGGGRQVRHHRQLPLPGSARCQDRHPHHALRQHAPRHLGSRALRLAT